MLDNWLNLQLDSSCRYADGPPVGRCRRHFVNFSSQLLLESVLLELLEDDSLEPVELLLAGLW